MRISTNFMEVRGQNLVILALENSTERKMREQIRIENARLRTATETAAAVCQEMSQPLMAMTELLDLLIMDSEQEDRKLIEAFKEQFVRLGNILKKLMNLKSYRTGNYSGGNQILDVNGSN